MLKQKKALHLIHDDKFFDAVFPLFNNIQDVYNDFVIFNKKPTDLIYIKNIKSIRIINRQSNDYKQLIRTYYDIIIIHYLNDLDKLQFIKDYKSKTKIVWFAWGGDFYDKIKYPLLQPISQDLFIQQKKNIKASTKTFILIRILRTMRSKIRKLGNTTDRLYNDSVKKIDFCATVIPNEFYLLEKLKGFKAKQLFFNYTFESDIFDNLQIDSNANSIIIGNSNTWSNNHIDVYFKLKTLDLDVSKVIVPLNYGLKYEEFPFALDFGKELFKEKFYPITNFLPFEEYHSILKTCSIGVFNSNRQQALGNILIMLFSGAKVFLSDLSPTYEYFKKNGYFIYSFQKEFNKKEIESKLTFDEIAQNRRLIIENYGNLAIQKKVKTALDLIFYS